jgi:hypothetical protein
MKPTNPPVMATKLLARLVSGPYREALAGDLVEQYRQGRSGTWYWRQVLFGILAGVAKDIGNHKLLAARSAVIGLAIYLLSSFPVNWLVYWLSTHGFLARGSGLRIPEALSLLVYLACGLTGWIAYRMHRAHPFTTVCIYSVSVLLFESVHISFGLLLDGGRHQIELPSQMLLLGVFLLRPLSIMIGGIAGSIRLSAPTNAIQSQEE